MRWPRGDIYVGRLELLLGGNLQEQLVSQQCCPNVDSEISRKGLRMLDLDLKRSEIDLNSRLLYSHCEAARGVLHEQWPNDFCSGDGFSSSDGIPSLRGTLPWRLQSAELLLLGSVSLFGLRPTHRARKPARYRSLSAQSKLYHLGFRGRISRNTL